ncbi:hypothetical protein Esi_0221_0028 [Ectocarpus siliculosus]|uniref:Uncharacterized protein n=1 Tax=Ectocarpus siliculosus TaxID=2880 RepID=D7FRW2_ECTSI|nr:hypothetical protein Esi_0221_0028 [Ectocarpus siliculosus]|eukprot:CBJ30903.1 hypothetical protein Esi_0221_0028 [Ectocarpus siliculosus]
MVVNWLPRIVRLQNPVRIRADGATSGNVRWLSRPLRPGSEPQLADDPSCGDLRTASVSQNPEARRRRDGGLAVHPREVEPVRRLALESEIFAAGSIVGIDADIGHLRLFLRLLDILWRRTFTLSSLASLPSFPM